MKRSAKIAILLAVALGIGVGAKVMTGDKSKAGAHAASDQNKGKHDPISMLELTEADIFRVQLGEFRRTLALSGNLQAVSETIVNAKQGGQIANVLVREGDAVKAGQLLATMDDAEVRQRLNERQAQLESYKAEAAYAERNREQNRELMTQAFISQEAFNRIDSDTTVKQAQLKAQIAQLELARKSMRDTKIASPITGYVATRDVHPGQDVAPGAKLFSVIDLSQLEYVAQVPAADIASVHAGQLVRLKVDGYGGRQFEGKVERINPAAQPGTRSIAVYIRINNTDHSLRTGLFASGDLQLDTRPQAIAVPDTAVVVDKGASYIWVMRKGHLEKVVVTVGPRDARTGKVEVSKGVTAGDTVILAQLSDEARGAAVKMAGGKH
ncbi:efflux RND transporter periplasmic adaptor subunit [Chitinivorax sp. B]|uniref:efflux RND transporter periplasmic adaptor subunit n=1 Tax=Chitinivorax sp. B TaxID=2502235 RepID=UPI002017DD76|nr:efflux RND transporter periplasmic adaptor subunit [Chitinivorax sp. B]